MAVLLEEIVRRVNDLPVLPRVVARVLTLTGNPNSSIKELNDAICKDQALTVKVLRLSNSAYYSYHRRIATITDAIGILGFTAIRNLVLVTHTSTYFNKGLKGYRITKGDIFRHSVTCAMAARSIAKHARFPSPDSAFTAGLLHDVGKVILDVYVGAAYDEIARQMQEEQQVFSTVEDAILGFTHAAVGGRVAERWNLPTELVEAIACHHTPLEASENPQLAAIVHIADAVCLSMEIDTEGDGLYYPYEGQALVLAGLESTDLAVIKSELRELVSDENIFQLENKR
jgi:putative nucleotidyltransferase with HDIG domain